jgi:glyoxylase-like metal-dependent hydrolase (beta-lactamase superfamily II)
VLAVPTPFLVGRVNCYLVEDDPLTLVDAGPNSGTSLVELTRMLAEHGRRIEDIERLVLTHQHADHIGLAHIVADRSDAEVCALAALGPWLSDYSLRTEADDTFAQELMRAHGVPPDVVTALRSVGRLARAWGAPVEVTTKLQDGETLGFAGRSWRVHHRPGHSPSDIVLHDEATGELVGGDHLIRHISSNAVISRPLEGPEPPERPRPLLTYIGSLRATAAMDVSTVLPGHGEAFGEHRALVEDRFTMHERRATKIAGLLAARPLSAYEIAQELWGNVAITQAYLTLSEVLGHVDLLLERGAVVEQEEDGLVRFAAPA